MGIEKSIWGQGYGAKLFETMFKWAESTALKKIELSVISTNQRAIALYKKMGLVMEGELKDSMLIHGKLYSETLMARFLS